MGKNGATPYHPTIFGTDGRTDDDGDHQPDLSLARR